MRIPDPLYQQIVAAMPIPCVDLLVADLRGVLLLRRVNEPALGQWWFPGGRVFHGETRPEAAKRKLYQECGLEAEALCELGTYDVLLKTSAGGISHGITTVFVVTSFAGELRLDAQSDLAEWRPASVWRGEGLHPFVNGVIEAHSLRERSL